MTKKDHKTDAHGTTPAKEQSIAPQAPLKDAIVIRGAKMHNLKNINVSIPRNKLTVITGLSGSVKKRFGVQPQSTPSLSGS